MSWKVILTRFNYGDKQALGYVEVLRDGECVYEAKSLELPWKDNQRSVSCIPEDIYKVRKRLADESGSRDYDHFMVMDVPNRSYILWHAGNFYWDIEGCILMGQAHIDINHDTLKDVTDTKRTIAELYALLPNQFDFVVTSTIEEKQSIA
jgi:hypothetical protein